MRRSGLACWAGALRSVGLRACVILGVRRGVCHDVSLGVGSRGCRQEGRARAAAGSHGGERSIFERGFRRLSWPPFLASRGSWPSGWGGQGLEGGSVQRPGIARDLKAAWRAITTRSKPSRRCCGWRALVAVRGLGAMDRCPRWATATTIRAEVYLLPCAVTFIKFLSLSTASRWA